MFRTLLLVSFVVFAMMVPVGAGQDLSPKIETACRKLETICVERLDGRKNIAVDSHKKHGTIGIVQGKNGVSLHWEASRDNHGVRLFQIDVSSGRAYQKVREYDLVTPNVAGPTAILYGPRGVLNGFGQDVDFSNRDRELSLSEVEELIGAVVKAPRVEMPKIELRSAEYIFDYDLKGRKPYQAFEDAAAHGRYLARGLRLARERPEPIRTHLASLYIRDDSTYLMAVKPLLEHGSTEARDKAALSELRKVVAEVEQGLAALRKTTR